MDWKAKIQSRRASLLCLFVWCADMTGLLPAVTARHDGSSPQWTRAGRRPGRPARRAVLADHVECVRARRLPGAIKQVCDRAVLHDDLRAFSLPQRRHLAVQVGTKCVYEGVVCVTPGAQCE